MERGGRSACFFSWNSFGAGASGPQNHKVCNVSHHTQAVRTVRKQAHLMAQQRPAQK